MAKSFLSLPSKSFLNISSDNRLHLWDIDTRKEKRSYVEKNHLSHTYTCFKWQQGKDNLGKFAVGANDGSVIVWDLVRGIIERTIGADGSLNPAVDIAFSNDSKNIIVATQSDTQIYKIEDGLLVSSISSGKKGVTAIAMNPKVDVLASAKNSIRLIDIHTNQKKKLKASFPNGVNCIKFSPCGRFLAATGLRNREIIFFDIQADSSSQPMCVAALEGFPSSIEITSNSKGEITALCLFEEGDGGCIVRVQTTTTTASASTSSSGYSLCRFIGSDPLLAGSFPSPKEGSGLISLVVGSPSKPRFLSFRIEDETGLLLGSLTLPSSLSSSSESIALEGKKFSSSSSSSIGVAVVLGPNEIGEKKKPSLKKSRSGSIGGEGEGEENDGAEEGGGEKKRKKEDFMSRMRAGSESEEALSSSLTRLEKNLQSRLEERNSSNNNNNHNNNHNNAQLAPTSDSVVVLLEQALQANDDTLLEQCLHYTNLDVVDSTTRGLPTNRVIPLLRKLVSKFEKRPSRGILLTRWLFALLRHHTSYLISIPHLAHQLAGLSSMLEQRLSTYCRMVTLSGRLEILRSHLQEKGIHRGATSGGGELDGEVGELDLEGSKEEQEHETLPRRVYQEE